MEYNIILFQSTHDAIRAEKVIGASVPVTVMPVPRFFSTSCGISLRFARERDEEVRSIMEAEHLRGSIEQMPDQL